MELVIYRNSIGHKKDSECFSRIVSRKKVKISTQANNIEIHEIEMK